MAGVGLGIEGESRAIIFGSVTEVNPSSQFSHYSEVGAPADLGFQGGAVDQRLRSEAARAEVAEGAELFAELEETLLGTDGGCGTPFWTADGAEEDGVGGFGGLERLGCEWVVVDFDGCLGTVIRTEAVTQSGEVTLTPPRRCSWRLNLPAEGLFCSIALRTCCVVLVSFSVPLERIDEAWWWWT